MVDKLIARARSVLGAPFRLHGRDPETGLDCVGLIAWVYELGTNIPAGYALRGGDGARFAQIISALGLTKRRAAFRAGDLLLMQAGAAQFHLGLWTGTSLIHADAMLRRTVEMPGTPPWQVIGAWHNQRRKI
jgi:murein DD-endopeptidase / murein LD-carboxypeptidase